MPTNYNHITRAMTRNVKPGVMNVAWIAPRDWFDTLQEPVPGGTGAATKTISLTHIFADPLTQGFVKCYCQPKKNSLAAGTVGEVGAKWLDWTLTVVIPGDSIDIQVIMEELMNDDLILLVKDLECPEGSVYQLGCDCTSGNAEEVKFEGKTQGDTTGKAWTITAKASCRYLYTGDITEMP